MTRSESASGMLVGGSTAEPLFNRSCSWSSEVDTAFSGFVIVVSNRSWWSSLAAGTGRPRAASLPFAFFRRCCFCCFSKLARSLPSNSMAAVALV